MESEVNLMRSAVTTTRKSPVVHCVIVLFKGWPREVKQLDDVCTSDNVTAFTAITRIKVVSVDFSSGASEENMNLEASGAAINSAIAAGSAIAKVISSALYAFFLAAEIFPLSAKGEIWGTLAAASP